MSREHHDDTFNVILTVSLDEVNGTTITITFAYTPGGDDIRLYVDS